ncbi:MAG: EpsD family peptidyl-prolyl cis-trans isomerase [Pseudomonadota bacterium]
MAGCGDKKDEAAEADDKPASQVVAKVNGTELTVHQVNFALQRIPKLNPEQSKAASLQVVRNLVDQELALQQALADKLDRDPAVVQALDASRRQILAEAWMGRKIGAPVEPTDAEVQEYFNAHPELFAERKLYRLQEISIKVPEDQREKVRAQLAASKSLNEFGEWLKAQNLEVKVVQGVKPAEQLPLAVLPQLSKMSKGQATVLNTPDGLLVVIVADTQARAVMLEQAKPAIAAHLQGEARQKAIQAQVDALKAAAKIEYLGEFADAGKEPAATAAPAAPAEKAAESAPDADAEAISKGVSGLK